MDRTLKFLATVDETGEAFIDRDEIRQALLDLEGTIAQIGGMFTVSAVRQQVGPDDFEPQGVLIRYSSFSPATSNREVEVATG